MYNKRFSDEEFIDNLSSEIYFTAYNPSNERRIHYSKYEEIKNKYKYKLFRKYCQFFIKNKRVKTSFEEYKDIKVACILDEFSYSSYKDIFTLIPLTKENYLNELKEADPDILFVESAWNSYQGGFNISESLEDIKSITTYCKYRGIKTIFWNKEDPVHYSHFIKKAILFDYVFTTDDNCIKEYLKFKKNNVYSLMFACQPMIHNPMHSKHEKIGDITFAGTCYRNKYKDRLTVLNRMLYAGMDYHMDIYDRNSLLQRREYSYLKIFNNYLKPKIDYQDIDKVYKGYWVNLNLNTVTNSQTMFSRRVFELLACGSLVVSNPSKGLDKYFKDIVLVGSTVDDFQNIYAHVLNNTNQYDKTKALGIRTVLKNHTYQNRAKEILDIIGINVKQKETIVACILKEDCEETRISYKKQSYKNKKLFTINDINNHYNEILSCDKVVILSKENYYGENYILDLVLAYKYSQVPFIGKKEYYCYDNHSIILCNQHQEYENQEEMDIDAGILSISTIKNKEQLLQYLNTNKYIGKSLSIDKYNFVRNGIHCKEKNLKEFSI